MSTPTPVAQKKYMLAQTLYEIPYFAEGSEGYGDCPDLDTLDAPHRMCRAQVKGGVLKRIYAGLVEPGDARASAIRRQAGGHTYAYMKGSVAEYNIVRETQFTQSQFQFYYSKRLAGYPAYNAHFVINSTGGHGRIGKWIGAECVTVQEFTFDENIGVHEKHEWWLCLDSGLYSMNWSTEFLGKTYEKYFEYPGSTPA